MGFPQISTDVLGSESLGISSNLTTVALRNISRSAAVSLSRLRYTHSAVSFVPVYFTVTIVVPGFSVLSTEDTENSFGRLAIAALLARRISN